jgi:uncharacterized membrane protein YjfL (UPF0719 family)
MRILTFIIALVITAFIVAAVSWVIYSEDDLFPKDALIIQTHGDNKKIQHAITSLNLSHVETIDTSLIRRASFTSSVIWNILNTAITLVIFLSVTRVLKLLFRKQQTEQGAAANP